ncbi:acyl transferase, partial [Bacteroidota bacterium]
TTSLTPAKHYIVDLELYRESFMMTFQQFYGDISQYCIIGLLPSYLERKGSSLIYMIDHLISKSQNSKSGFYLYDHESLKNMLEVNISNGQKTILFGVTFALLDFAEKYKINFPDLIVIETGGMKGRREEMIREDLHHKIRIAFGLNKINSEYGMTELMSQAYSKGDGMFECPPWMKVLIGNIHNPQEILSDKKTGNINIIDLANVFTCSFLSTQDLGIKHPNNTFEVLGRIDYSDIRGCSLLV